ncbi:cyclic nucleotide-binding protein [Psychromonas sp. RZ22]|uniref:polysaccharide lyase family 7 protein n=1 Tax=Psychromonas algarum TaxID=2555643 RepID=UPI0010676CA9|nr:polysaccharide lyase family 7 protein [Psychromonas sp. RZ22]TEW56855.1 cyclic nucleotide-binding protein [Psychromonas sp. RZ22]
MKYNIPTLLLLSLSLTACGGGGSGGSSYDENQNYGDSPYDYPKYQDVLDVADLEQNGSTVKNAGEFTHYSDSHFKIDSTSNWLTFNASGEGKSSELRFTNNFKTNSSDFYRLTAEILPTATSDSQTTTAEINQNITLLQIDNDDGYAPLARIIWQAETREQHSNSYWAVINTGSCNANDTDSNCYEYTYLADYNASTPSKFEMLVESDQLKIKVNEQQKVSEDTSYWPTINNYFRAGVVNHYAEGSSTVQFKTLTYNTNIPVANLDPNATPSDNFDLLDWYLSVPVARSDGNATSVSAKTLNGGYENSDYFYTNTTDGGMVFVCPIDGPKTSTNTTYTRTELREMLSRGNSTSAKNMDNNWVFSSAPESAQKDAAGVDGVLEATLAVNHVTTSGDSDQRGRVIIGQIHANDDEPIRLYYRLLPGHTKGSLYFAHEPRSGAEQWITLIGSTSDNASEPSDGIKLNEKFYYKIKVQGNLLIVTIKRDYKDDITRTWDMSGSGFDDADQYMYFKAGVYNQNKSGDGDDYVQATFYYLDNHHTGYNP